MDSEPQTPASTTGVATPIFLESAQSEEHDGSGSGGILFFTPRRRRALMMAASFDNLVALANHQERLKDARKIIWRDRGQPVVELLTPIQCLVHAVLGGFRSGSLALSIRACFNLVLALIRIHRVPRDVRFAVIRHAVFGKDTLRFGLMLGTFTSIYKFILNALPLLIPSLNTPQHNPLLQKLKITPPTPHGSESPDTPFLDDDDEDEEGPTAEHPTSTLLVAPPRRQQQRRRDSSARLSLSVHAQQTLIRKRTKRWHAALAGALAGAFGIMWEKRGRRDVIAQQLFVRGLQGSYNAYTTKRGIEIPHGNILVFCLACGQIMYSFLLRQDALPHSYNVWIGQASKVPQECVRMNCSLVRKGTFELPDLDKLISRKDITPANISKLLTFRSRSLSSLPSPSTYIPRYVPCSAAHPALTSCSLVPLDRFFSVFKWMLPIYGALHFVPAVLFKRQAFVQDPGKVLVKSGLGTMRSSAFLGMFVVIYQSLFCYKHKLHKYLTLLRLRNQKSSNNPLSRVPQALIDLLISKASFWFSGFAAGLSLFVEDKRRRGELAMYVLPKALESVWVMARGKGWVVGMGKWGDVWLTAIGMAMVMSTYQNDPQHLSGLVRRVMYQFIGPN